MAAKHKPNKRRANQPSAKRDRERPKSEEGLRLNEILTVVWSLVVLASLVCIAAAIVLRIAFAVWPDYPYLLLIASVARFASLALSLLNMGLGWVLHRRKPDSVPRPIVAVATAAAVVPWLLFIAW